ncbi:HesA/MoeB/ThiF family protein, partial [Actinokineospora sp.]|uniref:HesA/MoeB/ThiF family protein n=1 Tax=Actinokineospora sp. TaxID=1872133 RepID=UPI003D6AC0C5
GGARAPGPTAHQRKDPTLTKLPRLKPFLRVYRREGEPHLFIGVGPDKVRVSDPTPAAEKFILGLDGTVTGDELRLREPEADEWLRALDAAGVLEDAAVPPTLDVAVTSRWSRQINYLRLFDRDGWDGFEGQRRLGAARVVVVGTGAGGTTLLRLLNAAGIGRLEAVDFDTFALDNLPTHATLDQEDVGSHKLEALRRHLYRQNSNTEFVTHDRTIGSADDLAEIIDGADFFLHAFDRPREHAARWSSEASLATGVPMTSIGATDKGARVGPMMIPGVTPCWECVGIYGMDILRHEETACLTGSTVAMLAGIAVNEVVGVLSGAKESPTAGRSLYVDTDRLTFTFTDYEARPDCPCTRAA